MILVADDIKYVAHFLHFRDASGQWHTTCQLHEGLCQSRDCPQGSSLIGFGESRLHPKDQFSKFKGRKESLTRALRLGGFSQSARSQMWHSYFHALRTPNVQKDKRKLVDRFLQILLFAGVHNPEYEQIKLLLEQATGLAPAPNTAEGAGA